MRVHLLRRTHVATTGEADHGAIALIFALLMTVFLVLAAFAVDIANAYANARQLSVAADAASLGAAAKVGEAYTTQFPSASCSPANLASMNATQIASSARLIQNGHRRGPKRTIAQSDSRKKLLFQRSC